MTRPASFELTWLYTKYPHLIGHVQLLEEKKDKINKKVIAKRTTAIVACILLL